MTFFQFIPFLIFYSIVSAISGVVVFFDFKTEQVKVKSFDDFVLFCKLTCVYALLCGLWFILSAYMLLEW